jgi:hypothetical protein
MAQIFHPSTNALSRLTIFGGVFILAAIGWVFSVLHRSSYATLVNVTREQPVQFSHEHHVRGLGIDCRYCHTTVEETASAGMPATETCMSCHSQIWINARELAPVRESFKTDRSIEWTRVHDLPDFAYFDHSIHVAKGVGCASCHGRVDEMPLTWRVASLRMAWCLECHRNPEPHLRPREAVFDMAWTPPEDPSFGPSLAQKNRVVTRTDCSTCHR